MSQPSPNMFRNDDDECEVRVDRAVGTLSADCENIECCIDRSDESDISRDKSFCTITSTPIQHRNGVISAQSHESTLSSEDDRNQEQRNIVLRSGLKVALTQHKHLIPINEYYAEKGGMRFSRATKRCLASTFNEYKVSDDSSDSSQTTTDDDESFRSHSTSIPNPSQAIVYLDLTNSVIVKDDDHISPNASPEDLEEISRNFLDSLEATSKRKKIGNHTKTKRKLWTSNLNQSHDNLSLELEEEEPNRSSLDTENKEIKLRIPIPTYLIPLKFRKQQPSENFGTYSPATAAILNTTKAINRKSLIKRPAPSQICGFLESLDAEIVPNTYCDPNAYEYRRNFERKREDLLKLLLQLYNRKVFDDRLINASVFVFWTDSPLKTGGNCEYLKRGSSHMAEVSLSKKIATASQLRDTLINELCRAAAWVLDEDGALETRWKLWAERANQRLPELPLIEINRDNGYVYECTICHLSSFASQPKKSEQTFCANCHGPVEEFSNQKDLNGWKSLALEKKPSAYAKFVKKNYGVVKKENPNSTQVECMEILSQTFAECSLVQNKRKNMKKSKTYDQKREKMR